MSAHRRVRPTPALAGRAVLAGAAALGLGAGPLVGLASAAPIAHAVPTTTAAGPATTAIGPTTVATAPVVDGPGTDALWYGLLTTAAVAGAASAHQLGRGRPTRRA